MGFRKLFGSDYSELAIELAKKIANDKGASIEYFVDDLRNTICSGKYFHNSQFIIYSFDFLSSIFIFNIHLYLFILLLLLLTK